MMDRAGVQLVGDHVKHISVGKVANAELSAVGFQRDDVDINILSPAKVPVSYRYSRRCLVFPGFRNPPIRSGENGMFILCPRHP